MILSGATESRTSLSRVRTSPNGWSGSRLATRPRAAEANWRGSRAVLSRMYELREGAWPYGRYKIGRATGSHQFCLMSPQIPTMVSHGESESAARNLMRLPIGCCPGQKRSDMLWLIIATAGAWFPSSLLKALPSRIGTRSVAKKSSLMIWESAAGYSVAAGSGLPSIAKKVVLLSTLLAGILRAVATESTPEIADMDASIRSKKVPTCASLYLYGGRVRLSTRMPAGW